MVREDRHPPGPTDRQGKKDAGGKGNSAAKEKTHHYVPSEYVKEKGEAKPPPARQGGRVSIERRDLI